MTSRPFTGRCPKSAASWLSWLALWQLADRFGRVSPSGAVVTLPHVTHAVLAEVVAARRPSVTSAMNRLSANGLIEVMGRHRWLLRLRPEEGLRMLSIHSQGRLAERLPALV